MGLTKRYTWMFFDVGGTIFDDEPVYQFQEDLIFGLLNDHGFDVPETEFKHAVRTCRARYLPKYVNQLIWSFIEEEELFHRVMSEYEMAIEETPYEKFQELIRPLPGVRDLLLDLHQSIKLGIIGNQPSIVRQRLEEEKMIDLFDVQAISAEMELQKPDLRFYLAALAMAGCHAGETMMIGDRLDNDVYPARSLGMTTVQLKFGPHRRQPVLSPEYLPHFTCSSIHQLSRLLLSGISPSSSQIKKMSLEKN